ASSDPVHLVLPTLWPLRYVTGRRASSSSSGACMMMTASRPGQKGRPGVVSPPPRLVSQQPLKSPTSALPIVAHAAARAVHIPLRVTGFDASCTERPATARPGPSRGQSHATETSRGVLALPTGPVERRDR